ncbi:MAG: GNAT family N-acetyltransferase [Clostridiales bacterium]|nr:GNAT family N-acetyltransferase [Clostridiales bacterium]
MYTDTITIRTAVPEDAAALLTIYAPYVTDTAITFEYEVPSVEEFTERITQTLEKYPYLVAEYQNAPVGYAYASSFHPRAAYAWCAETSIYIQQNFHGRGVGKLLYAELEKQLVQQHVLNLNACIAYPNPGSIAFHKALGFTTIGHFHNCGFKLNRWYDMIWMEKMIGEHNIPPEPFVPAH